MIQDTEAQIQEQWENGLKERNLTLQISTRIKEILSKEYQDVSIKMSRTGDTFPSLSDRTNQANAWGADFFLSIHINSGGGTGFESYIYPSSGTPATTYQSAIHSEVLKLVNYTDILTATIQSKLVKGYE